MLLLTAAAAGCGKKGPPLPPLLIVPAPVENLVVRRLGDQIHVQLSVPSQNVDGATPADLARVEVFALTGRPLDERGRPFTHEDYGQFADVIARVNVRPPPPPPGEEGEDGEAGDPRPAVEAPVDPGSVAQGERVAFGEFYTPELDTRVVDLVDEPAEGDVGGEEVEAPAPLPLTWPPVEPPLTRRYVAVGLNARGQPGPFSVQAVAPLGPAPPPPSAPAATYSETALQLTWTPAPGARAPIQAPAAAGQLAPRLVFSGPPPHTYNVYEIRPGAERSWALPVPLNAAPLPTPAYSVAAVRFGTERCFAVRTVETTGGVTMESELSASTCLTPVDSFAPAAPSALVAVGSAEGVSLIWRPSPATDLAGYIVLRGTEQDGPLVGLFETPIVETTYRDETGEPGVSYVYAVVAADTASPANRSVESNRVVESAR